MANKPNKTQPTEVSVEAFLAAVTRRRPPPGAVAVCDLMARLSGEPARMWGPVHCWLRGAAVSL